MAIEFSCPRCDRRYSVSEAMAGRRVTCKACGQERTVPGASSAAQPAPAVSRPVTPPRPAPSRASAVFEEDDRDAPLDDFDELPSPRRPAARSAPARVRKGTASAGISPIVYAGLALIVGLVAASGIYAIYAANARGRGDLTAPIYLVMVSFAGLALCVIGHLGITLHAAANEGPGAGLLCFFVPFYSLMYNARHSAETQRYVWPYGLGLVAVIGCSWAAPLVRHQAGRPGAVAVAAPEDDGPQLLSGHAVILVVATNLPDQAATEVFGEKLARLPRGPGRGFQMMSTGDGRGTQRYEIDPVADVRAFADAMTFARVSRVSGRTIYAEASLDEPELAERRAKIAATQAEHEARMAQHHQGADPANPFQPRARAADAPADPNAGPVDRALAELKSSNDHKVKEAVTRLRYGVPEDRREQVAEALTPLLEHRDIFLVNEVLTSLTAIRGVSAVPAILNLLGRPFVGDDALKALGDLRDPRAIGPILDRLERDGHNAAEALVKIGPEAEAPVIEKLRDSSDSVRRSACEILARIGTAEAVRAMRALPADPDGLVRLKATEAMKQILARVGPVPLSKGKKAGK